MGAKRSRQVSKHWVPLVCKDVKPGTLAWLLPYDQIEKLSTLQRVAFREAKMEVGACGHPVTIVDVPDSPSKCCTIVLVVMAPKFHIPMILILTDAKW